MAALIGIHTTRPDKNGITDDFSIRLKECILEDENYSVLRLSTRLGIMLSEIIPNKAFEEKSYF